MKQADLNAIRQAVREEITAAIAPSQTGYLDAPGAARYLSISPRTFADIAQYIPYHRLSASGKRLYKREDLDRYMAQHRQAPATKEQIDAVVNDVLGRLRAAK